MKISYSHVLPLRIRYSETDQMGFCYYGNYPVFLEVARVEMLRNLEFALGFGLVFSLEFQ